MKTMYTNGTILTNNQSVEALVEENGKIIAIGKRDSLYEENMKIVDLGGQTLMSSFIDSHSHLSGMAMSFLQVDLSNCQSLQDIQECIQSYIEDNPDKDFVVAQGYNHQSLKEERHITKVELDSLSLDKVIILQHQSGHNGVVNTKGLNYLNIDENTYVDGGYIDYQNGFLEENAFIENVKKIPMSSLEELKEAFIKAQRVYASYGITTIQEGMLVDELYDIYNYLIEDNAFFLDVVGYVGFDTKRFDIHQYNDYYHHFRLGGYKMFLDGSPQNKTAWTIETYTDRTHGYPTLTDEQIERHLQKAIKENKQVLAHCNGDQAIEHYINIYNKVKEQDIRPVIIHAQMMNESQMKQASLLNMIPSFFVSHVYYFGDIHKKNMGIKRAQTISPLKTASLYYLPFTLHQDSPVLPPNMLETISIAMNRKTKSGDILGKDERISVEEALKAITVHAAYQYHEENDKGTLEVGKKADMIILNKNPLETDIKDIEIVYTIKEGRVINKN